MIQSPKHLAPPSHPTQLRHNPNNTILCKSDLENVTKTPLPKQHSTRISSQIQTTRIGKVFIGEQLQHRIRHTKRPPNNPHHECPNRVPFFFNSCVYVFGHSPRNLRTSVRFNRTSNETMNWTSTTPTHSDRKIYLKDYFCRLFISLCCVYESNLIQVDQYRLCSW